MGIGPISPKAHGAWLGAGTGAAIADEIISLVQTYGTHAPLPASTSALIFTVVPAVVAFLGAWLAPLVPASMKRDAARAVTDLPVAAELVPELKKLEPIVEAVDPAFQPVTTGSPSVRVVPVGTVGAGGGGSATSASDVTPGTPGTSGTP